MSIKRKDLQLNLGSLPKFGHYARMQDKPKQFVVFQMHSGYKYGKIVRQQMGHGLITENIFMNTTSLETR